MTGWLTDPKLPLGFNSEEALKDYLRSSTSDKLKRTLKNLKKNIEIMEWRARVVQEVLEAEP